MTTVLAGDMIARRLEDSVPDSVEDWNASDVWVKPQSILNVCRFLKEDSELCFDYPISVSVVDYIEYFEMVYHLVSIKNNHSVVVKAKCWGREDVNLPSVTDVWKGVDFQEREIYDLMGISFIGHPNLKRLLLWEGFPGHPQRKDYLELPR